MTRLKCLQRSRELDAWVWDHVSRHRPLSVYLVPRPLSRADQTYDGLHLGSATGASLSQNAHGRLRETREVERARIRRPGLIQEHRGNAGKHLTAGSRLMREFSLLPLLRLLAKPKRLTAIIL